MKLGAPKLLSKDETSLTIQWEKAPPGTSVEGYKLRYRQETDPEWSALSESAVKGTQVRKKNLEEGKGYLFQVMPVVEMAVDSSGASSADWAWSPASEKLVPGPSLSPALARLLPPTLLTKNGTVSTASALGGKAVGVYFSASWCPPCRSYTPMVADVYRQAKQKKSPFEIVFVSCDNSEDEFQAYFKDHHPWLAMDYNDPDREAFMGKFSVRGIPRLVILKPSGEILVDNVGGALDVDRWVQQCGL